MKGLLLDTHAWLWAVSGSKNLPRYARDLIAQYDGPVYLSAASVIEMAIKASIGKLEFAEPDLARFVTRVNAESNIQLLEQTLSHVAAVQHLPWHHRDPFDRMIIAQAKEMGLVVVTRDPSFTLYGLETKWDKGLARSR